MKIIADDDGRTGFVYISDKAESHCVELDQNTYASISEDGEFLGLDLMDTTPFGVPFDEAAAHRALSWARERLGVDTAS